VPRSAPKVRAFCKNLLRKKMAPQNSRAKVCGVEAPREGRRTFSVGQRGRFDHCIDFVVQNHLPPHQTNATNFVLVLISSPYSH